MVLLSPFPESILSFTGSWKALTEKSRIIAIDLSGFGAFEGDPSNAKHLDAAMLQSKLQILPEAGHLAWADQPELFAEMIIDWVETTHK